MNKLLKSEKKFEAKIQKEYEVKSIINSMIYSKKANIKILSFNHFVLWKGYLKEKNI